MWPFKKKRKIKPVLKDIWFDIYTTDGERTIQLDSKVLYDILDTEQIEYLNSLVPEQHEPVTKTFQEIEKEMVRRETEERAEAKRNPVTVEQRLENPDSFSQYFLNNKDKMILSPEENDKLHEMLENIDKHRREVEEKLKSAEESGELTPRQRESIEKFTDTFIKAIAEKGAKMKK